MKRFWNKVSVSSPQECWNWNGTKNEKGYGLFSFLGKMKGAHRVSWILLNGEIELGKMVLHSCDNPSCVNPAHLSLGTAKDNTADAIAKNRFPQITATGVNKARGERNGSAKLFLEDVYEIRKSNLTITGLAKKFRVCRTTIRNIKRRNKWAHVS